MNNSPLASAEPALDDPRWDLLRNRTAVVPEFYYAVKTTGIFCRLGCRSRLPNRGNVRFFDSPAQALAAGFTPCKRCQPEGPIFRQQLRDRITRICRLIEQSEEPASIGDLARRVGMSQSHFQRLFKYHVGVSPRQYHTHHRLQRFKANLRRGGNVTRAIYRSGFGSATRAYQDVTRKLGMPPRRIKAGGSGETIRYGVAKTNLGFLLVALSSLGVCSVALGDSPAALRRQLQAEFPKANICENSQELAQQLSGLAAFAENPRDNLDLPLDIRGTAFQHRVWRALQSIPPGDTRTYQQLAQAIGCPTAVRAVAAACAANKLALLIPCHRAVRTDGTLAGYRWGLDRKRNLLAIENKKGQS